MKFTFLLVRGNLFHSKILCPTLAVREGINHRVFKISTITLSSGDTTSFILTSVTYRLFKFQKVFLLSWDGTIQKRKGSHQKKTGKKVHKKSAFFKANFPKKNMLKLIHNVPFICLYKIQSLNSFKIPG